MNALWLVVLLAAGDPPAPSDDAVAEAKVHAQRGETHYALGEFALAVDEFKAAYQLVPRAGLLFNLAQCYAQQREWDLAAFSYRAYLRGTPDAPNAALVEELIAEAEQQAASARAARAPSALFTSAMTVGIGAAAVAAVSLGGALAVEGALLTDFGDHQTRTGMMWTGKVLLVGAALFAATSIGGLATAAMAGGEE